MMGQESIPKTFLLRVPPAGPLALNRDFRPAPDIREFVRNHREAYTGVRDLLHLILTRIFNRPDFGMLKLCLQQIVIPRIRVQVFLENLLLRRPEKHTGILLIHAVLPAAILGPVFAARYDCAARATTLLTFTHIVVSPLLVPAVFALIS
jgi:hypothetical protein